MYIQKEPIFCRISDEWAVIRNFLRDERVRGKPIGRVRVNFRDVGMVSRVQTPVESILWETLFSNRLWKTRKKWTIIKKQNPAGNDTRFYRDEYSHSWMIRETEKSDQISCQKNFSKKIFFCMFLACFQKWTNFAIESFFQEFIFCKVIKLGSVSLIWTVIKVKIIFSSAHV